MPYKTELDLDIDEVNPITGYQYKIPRYVEDFQERIINEFVIQLKKENLRTKGGVLFADLIKYKLEIQSLKSRKQRINAYNKIIKTLDVHDKFIFVELDNKINDICRRSRVIANNKIVQCHNEKTPKTADSFEYVIKKFAQHKVQPYIMQEFIDIYCKSCFSLTAHPTNPHSVEYTKAGIYLSRVLASNKSTKKDLINALQKIINTTLISNKKTPLEEVDETLATLDVIYDETSRVRQNLQAALHKNGYKNVVVTTPILQPCTWRPGDGDGNPNANAEVLDLGFKKLRSSIIKKYIKDLAVLSAELSIPSQEHIREIINNLNLFILKINSGKISHDELMDKLDIFKRDLKKLFKIYPANKKISDLIHKVETYGFHYAKCDIRHESNDIMDTISCIAQEIGLSKEKLLSEGLSSKKIMDQIHKIVPSSLEKYGEKGKVAARLLGRVRVLGQNPDMSEKLIIAECKSQEHVLAAMLLLIAGGNEIGNKNSKMDIVTLSESTRDLINLKHTISNLLQNETYRNHVKERGNRIVVQIAKSDTVRRGGRGVEDVQEQAVRDLYEIGKKYGIEISVFNGGGDPIQRGGGRIQETAFNHGRMAQEAKSMSMGTSTLTVQGHQMQMVFPPNNINLESFASQNLYAIAKSKRLIETGHAIMADMPSKNAKTSRSLECKAERIAYRKYIGDATDKNKGNPAFNNLMKNAGYVTREFCNTSSRPSKRKALDRDISGETQITPLSIKGDNPKLTQRRSIGVERISAHSGTHLISVLGVKEGLESIKDRLHETFLHNKSARDSWRGTAIILSMMDYDIAWKMLIGKDRPTDDGVNELADKFDQLTAQGKDNPEVTLAWLEKYARDTEKLLYKAIIGHEVDSSSKDKFKLGVTLKHAWPEVYEQISKRNRLAEFSKHLEASLTSQMNSNEEMFLSPEYIKLLKASYSGGADICSNTPAGTMATLTRKIAGKKELDSFEEKAISSSLSLPACLGPVISSHL